MPRSMPIAMAVGWLLMRTMALSRSGLATVQRGQALAS